MHLVSIDGVDARKMHHDEAVICWNNVQKRNVAAVVVFASHLRADTVDLSSISMPPAQPVGALPALETLDGEVQDTGTVEDDSGAWL
jgi:hypothetical protein